MKVKIKKTGEYVNTDRLIFWNKKADNWCNLSLDEIEIVQDETSNEDNQLQINRAAGEYAKTCTGLNDIEENEVILGFLKGAEFAYRHPVENIDWEQRRFELIKAALQGLSANEYLNDISFGGIADMVIEQADAVIEKLKAE